VPQNSDNLVQDIEESIDGTRLITHDKGFAPRLWDAKRQILLRVLDGHPDAVSQIGFAPNGSRVMTLSKRELRIWDSRLAKPVAQYAAAKEDDLTAAAFSPDGAHLAVGTAKGAVLVLDASDPRKATKLGAHTKAVRCLAYSPDGKRIVSGSDDATGRVWDAAANRPLWQVAGHQGAVRWASFSPKGDLALTTGFDNQACLWNASGKLLRKYRHVIGQRGVANVMMGAVFAGKGGAEIAVGGATGDIEIYSPAQEKPVAVLKGHIKPIRELRRSRDGRYLATYGDDETLRLWDSVERKQLPFKPEDGSPTAGEFSPNRDIFWLGYMEGAVRQYDVRTGKSVKETLGSVTALGRTRLLGDPPMVWMRSDKTGTLFTDKAPAQHLFLDPTGTNKSLQFGLDWNEGWFSPDGRYLAFSSRSADFGFAVVDLRQDRVTIKLKTMFSAAWSADSKRLALLDDGTNEIAVMDPATGKPLQAWQWPRDAEKGGMSGTAFHPNGRWIVNHDPRTNAFLIWDSETGQPIREIGKFTDLIGNVTFSADGKQLFVAGWTTFQAIDAETGALQWERKFTESMGVLVVAGISDDGKRIGLYSHRQALVLDAQTGKPLLEAKTTADSAALSADGTRFLTATGPTAQLWDVNAKRLVREFRHADEVSAVQFAAEGSRAITVDRVGGMNVWDLEGKKLASVVMMRDGSWLAYDPQGRFDAPDPSNIDGAYFVLEWAEGLEPITMPQLKAQYYEPHLLAKALGLDKEPLRDVPTLESLRLYPDLSVKAAGDQAYAIEAKERDEGGIGTVRVSINGKEVLRKKGASYVKFDLASYASFLLPEARLEKGRKNQLSVTVTNEAGDLMSPPETLGVEVPPDLKAPEVRLYALCVGIGDYVGTASDLAAPPSDARAVGTTLKEVADRLLPGRTDVTVLTTATEDPRPTRTHILGWLKETAKKATSSDIVFVFVAGHGMSRIGDQSGYFMLTSEADPGDITPASAATGAISGEELRQALSAIPAGKQVVVLDTCHSGAAADTLIGSSRSISGEYQRAWEAIKDTTGTWLLAGAASDQLSYESANVDHGMLTYALLEAVDHASAEGLRQTPSGELFVDVERWLNYAANRVESLKHEVGIKGLQRPEFKRATRGTTFDIGVMDAKRKGFLDLKAPKPIVIVGGFEMDDEDPLNLEDAVAAAMRDAKDVKAWFDVAKHPSVYRMTGDYSVDGDTVKVKLILQAFDDRQQRKNLESVEVNGTKANLAELATKIRAEIEARIKAREAEKATPGTD
jgi:WD40 repeat protein